MLARDNKARREMKTRIYGFFREDSLDHSQRLDVSKDSLYQLCHKFLSSLVPCLSEVTGMDGCQKLRI